jgi:UDP-3-O-[3-hydroxymyristoyl] glucosamine N-acyltransferase
MFNLAQVSDHLIANEESKREFSNVGFVDTTVPNSLSFIERREFLDQALENSCITGLLVNPSLITLTDPRIIQCDFPRFAFIKLHNSYGRNSKKSFKSIIDSTAKISPSAIVSKTDVIIEPGVVIEEYCVIGEQTTIESDAIVRSGCIVGSTALYIGKGFEGKRLSAKHFGATKIGRGTELGPNSVIDRGMFANDVTKVDCENFIGPLCNISHSVNIGPRNFIAAGVLISGYTSIESDNWIGPAVTISHKIKIGSRNHISLGSSLLRSIQHDTKVIGGRIFENEFPVRR